MSKMVEYNADGWVCNRYPTKYTDVAGAIEVSDEEYSMTFVSDYGYAWAVVDGALVQRSCGTDAQVDATLRIGQLKRMLSDTDYHVIKHAEGREVPDYENIIAQRESWRAEINSLQEQYPDINPVEV